ncbi:Pimeloyl-ACP methyl ester carboxylesterase [Rhodovulum sp. ES.010]|uniref:alpha/beta fold hydrolase n=1 Tax=Rhodovulum sp. ES.010 TaxID=1882821 RepID=UPI00092C3591|nr:alpha/beta fold hydrolase [Rhodovulum sp. ES.010]SIO17681.1 Pimeloyl-ACP methyl ester carboxylesterase [Rhodovulum sp. ES.010]
MPTRRTVTRLIALSPLAACAPTRDAQTEATRDTTYAPTGRLLQVRGRTVHAQLEGAGPPVILLHGASGNLRDFTFSLSGRLAPRYRVVAFDRPGLGFSDPLHGRGESPAEQAAQLEAAARQLGIGRAVVVGHSYGAAVAMAWALNHPGRVASVVTLAGATMPWDGELKSFYTVASSGLGSTIIAAFASRERAERALRSVFAPQSPPPGYMEHVGIELALRPGPLRTSARQVNTLRPHLVNMSARYVGLRVPVEVVHGTADRTVGIDIHSRPLARRLPNARLTALRGIGHMPHHAAERATVAAIDRAAARGGLR